MNGNKVFISYSWDNEEHKSWVLNLSNQLISDGIEVIIDIYDAQPGSNLHFFMEHSVKESNRIIVVFTPMYLKKAKDRKGGVGYEFSLINNELFKNITNNKKIIPILKEGTIETSIPEFLQQYFYLNFTNPEKFDKEYDRLIRELYKDPKIKRPKLGDKPNFSFNKIGERVNDELALIKKNVSSGDIHNAFKLALDSIIVKEDRILEKKIIELKGKYSFLKSDVIFDSLSFKEFNENSSKIGLTLINLLDK